jgi:thiol-disulfide isomerase/thioredoxin
MFNIFALYLYIKFTKYNKYQNHCRLSNRHIRKRIPASEFAMSTNNTSLEDITSPVDIKIFVTPQCSHCKKVKKIAGGFAEENPNITVTVIDVTTSPEAQKIYRVLATPKIVINEDIELTGDISRKELLGWMKKAGTPQGVLAKMLIQGEAEEVAVMAAKDLNIPMIMADMVVDVDLGLRIGAMIALIELWKMDPSALDGAIIRIAGHLGDTDARDRGDAAYILGEIGDESIIKELEALLDDPDDGVVEVAREALEAIRGRRQ